jgi:SAM-dependent methyltransferase
MLELNLLSHLAQRPPLFAPHDAPFWDDPYISKQMLLAHLDPTTDAASRRPETIDRSVEWLISGVPLAPGQKVLDLGCGPGLYCTRLSQRGLAVTGMDFSASSVDYARRQAAESQLPIEYVCQDYLSLDAVDEFDAILLIYYDFGVLSNEHRDELLRRIRRALKPGGAFVFDVQTPNHVLPPDGTTTWQVRPSGFWRPAPYLDLTEYFDYPDSDVHLRQTIIVDGDGKPTAYRIWEHYYTTATITLVLQAQGFTVRNVWSDLTGTPVREDPESLGVVALRSR